MEGAAPKIAVGGNSFAGQSCISVQRVLVQSSVVDQFTEALVAEVEGWWSATQRRGTDVSALIDRGETDRVKGWIDEAVSQGAELRTGGELTHEDVLRPTVLAGVRPEMEVCRTEVFGPLVGVQSFDSFEEALGMANDTRYGLQAGVFTSDLGKPYRPLACSTSVASSSTKCLRGVPTRCPTAGCAKWQHPRRPALHGPRDDRRTLGGFPRLKRPGLGAFDGRRVA